MNLECLIKVFYNDFDKNIHFCSSPADGQPSNVVQAAGLDLSKSFAQLSLPSPLQLSERSGPGQGLSVVARAELAARTQFGPLQGEAMEEKDIPEDFSMKDLWQVSRFQCLVMLYIR